MQQKQNDLVEVVALKAIAIPMPKDEYEAIRKRRELSKKSTELEGLTKMIYPGSKPVLIDRETAKKLQKAKAVEIVL